MANDSYQVSRKDNSRSIDMLQDKKAALRYALVSGLLLAWAFYPLEIVDETFWGMIDAVSMGASLYFALRVIIYAMPDS